MPSLPLKTFDSRCNDLEVMDDFNCQGPVVARTLKELEIINSWLGGNRITLNAISRCIKRLPKQATEQPLKIVDLGCGGGDIIKHIASLTEKTNTKVTLTGYDANPFIVNYAISNIKPTKNISFKTQNVLSTAFRKEHFDIVNCTLLCHHLDDETLSSFLRDLSKQTKYFIIINDLHRHWFAYYTIRILTMLFSSSSMVKKDAAMSVRKAFRKHEIDALLRKAGLKNYTINWKWAFRYEVIIQTGDIS